MNNTSLSDTQYVPHRAAICGWGNILLYMESQAIQSMQLYMPHIKGLLIPIYVKKVQVAEGVRGYKNTRLHRTYVEQTSEHLLL